MAPFGVAPGLRLRLGYLFFVYNVVRWDAARAS